MQISDGSQAYVNAWNLFLHLIDWMRTTVILEIMGQEMTFLKVLIACLIWKIVVWIIHIILPALGDVSDDDDSYGRHGIGF